MKKIFLVFIAAFIFTSCECGGGDDFIVIDAPAEIAERAFRFAELYKDSDTVYKFGGQDPVRSIKIDCSGLVVMCYKYAMTDTKYQLLISDMTSDYIYRNASSLIDKSQLRKGDLLFMGEAGSSKVTHIAVFEKIEDGKIYFIDSTQKDTDGDGADDINGVTRRNYSENDKRFKAFGIMRIKY